jgi:hypothetical protein
MPHFAFWTWPLAFVGSIHNAATSIAAIESTLPFSKKNPRAIWRGTSWYNNGASPNPRLRQELIKLTKDATWADVQPLKWTTSSKEASNSVRIEDFCRYKYIIYTEGVGYSGRLNFHQLCESVILSPPLEWIQHTTHLVKPIFSTNLFELESSLKRESENEEQRTKDAEGYKLNKRNLDHPSDRTKVSWPVTYPVSEANMIFVAPNWSDLEATVQLLEKYPKVAKGIARRQRELFAGGGYLSPAAEVCYWRALIRGWSSVADIDGEKGWEADGMSWEQFSLAAGR